MSIQRLAASIFAAGVVSTLQVHAYESKWQRVEADNGALYAIDKGSIAHNTNGSAMAAICVVDNGACPPMNMTRVIFDCKGHYQDVDGHGPVSMAPPRSVIGKMASIACAGAKDTRFDPSPSDNAPPNPAEYCSGFPPDACARMKSIVDSKVRPSFCAPGFGLVGSGLTPSQLRVCYVMTGPQFR